MDEILVFFDGECIFCNSHVRFLLKRDKQQRLMFAPLQGLTASEKLSPTLTKDLDSLVVTDGTKTYLKMDAVIACLKTIGGFWKWVGCFLGILPKFVRDIAYGFFAKNRYQWFGKLSECQLPTAAESSRFLP